MGNRDICSGAIAQTTFRFALCTHDDYVSSVTLETDSFASSAGPYTPPGGRGGSVGTDGAVRGNSLTVGGSLWTSGAGGVSANTLTVAGELRDQGALGPGMVSVDHDAFVGGDINVQALTVGGTLTLPAASMLSVAGANNAPRVTRAPVTIPAPCDFTNTLNIGAYVFAHETLNHNAGIVDAHQLESFTTTQLSLPCGRFYLTRINGGTLTLIAGGRTALFVSGDVTLMQDLTVQLADGAELDLFIAG